MLIPPREFRPLISGSSAMHARTEEPPQTLLGLTLTEWRRRLWHTGPGVLPFVLWAVPHQDPLSPTLEFVLFLLVLGFAAHVFLRYQAHRAPAGWGTGERGARLCRFGAVDAVAVPGTRRIGADGARGACVWRRGRYSGRVDVRRPETALESPQNLVGFW